MAYNQNLWFNLLYPGTNSHSNGTSFGRGRQDLSKLANDGGRTRLISRKDAPHTCGERELVRVQLSGRRKRF
jgi:hypothetical protein